MLADVCSRLVATATQSECVISEWLIEASALRAVGVRRDTRDLEMKMCVGGITGTPRHCASFVFAALHILPPLASQHGD